MLVHPFDYEFQNNFYTYDEIKYIYDESSRFQRWLNFESALIKAQAKFGIVKKEYAEEVVKNCNLSSWDKNEIREAYKNAKNSIIPLLQLLRNKCSEDARNYIHYGITTQDVIDTGEVIALKEILTIFRRDITFLGQILYDIADMHKETPMIGRSHGQHALPITFGYKTSLWLAEINRHLNRIIHIQKTCLFGQLGGAVGTFSVLEKPELIKQEVMNGLGLSFELQSWHTSRDRIAEIATTIAMLSETCGKIANEIFTLSRSEFLELSEKKKNSGKSSTMPHKLNPVLCQRTIVCVNQVRAQIPIILQAMGGEHERDPRELWGEWISIPTLMIFASTCLKNIILLLQNMDIHVDRMLENIRVFNDLICSEMLTFHLAPKIGKVKSSELVVNLSNQAVLQQSSLYELISNNSELMKLFDEDILSILKNPERCYGYSVDIADNILKTHAFFSKKG